MEYLSTIPFHHSSLKHETNLKPLTTIDAFFSTMATPGKPTGHPLAVKYSYLSIAYHDTLPFVTVVSLNRPKKRNAINSQVRYH